jgi:HD superfamily phosphodiesterase
MTMKARGGTGISREEITRLTEEFGGEWLVHHAERLVRLTALIGEGLEYNAEVLWIAAWLHDWGSCPKFTRPGVTHALRSRQVAEKYLSHAGCSPELRRQVLECIQYHHGGADEDVSIETLILHDADALDGLGVIGLLKECAVLPTEVKGLYSIPMTMGMQGAIDRAKIRMENNPTILKLPRSRELAKERLARMEKALRMLEQDSFGYL